MKQNFNVFQGSIRTLCCVAISIWILSCIIRHPRRLIFFVITLMGILKGMQGILRDCSMTDLLEGAGKIFKRWEEHEEPERE